MGYSSSNDCGSVVTDAYIKATASYMISSGFAAKGYTYVNIDEGLAAWPGESFVVRGGRGQEDLSKRDGGVKRPMFPYEY